MTKGALKKSKANELRKLAIFYNRLDDDEEEEEA